MAEDSDFQVSDFYNYRSNEQQSLSFKQIILEQINRCLRNGSTEWFGGHWDQRIVNGQVVKKYIQDTRGTFNNSVRMLRAALAGYFKKDYPVPAALDKNGNKEELVENYILLFENLLKLVKENNFFEEEEGESYLDDTSNN